MQHIVQHSTTGYKLSSNIDTPRAIITIGTVVNSVCARGLTFQPGETARCGEYGVRSAGIDDISPQQPSATECQIDEQENPTDLNIKSSALAVFWRCSGLLPSHGYWPILICPKYLGEDHLSAAAELPLEVQLINFHLANHRFVARNLGLMPVVERVVEPHTHGAPGKC